LQISADGENELVRNYLQQREQLMSQQMEQKKRYEGSGCRLRALNIHYTVNETDQLLLLIYGLLCLRPSRLQKYSGIVS